MIGTKNKYCEDNYLISKCSNFRSVLFQNRICLEADNKSQKFRNSNMKPLRFALCPWFAPIWNQHLSATISAIKSKLCNFVGSITEMIHHSNLLCHNGRDPIETENRLEYVYVFHVWDMGVVRSKPKWRATIDPNEKSLFLVTHVILIMAVVKHKF